MLAFYATLGLACGSAGSTSTTTKAAEEVSWSISKYDTSSALSAEELLVPLGEERFGHDTKLNLLGRGGRIANVFGKVPHDIAQGSLIKEVEMANKELPWTRVCDIAGLLPALVRPLSVSRRLLWKLIAHFY